MTKRGISPLIATVLLVAFSIALAAIVSTYVIGQAKKFKPATILEDSLICDSVSLDYSIESSVTGDPIEYKAVSGSSTIKQLSGIKFVNKGSFSIHKYVITAPGLQSSEQFAGGYDASCVFSKAELKPIDDPITPIPIVENKQNMCLGLKPYEGALIKIIPIAKDPETGNLVKCTKSQLIIDHKRLCKDFVTGCLYR